MKNKPAPEEQKGRPSQEDVEIKAEHCSAGNDIAHLQAEIDKAKAAADESKSDYLRLLAEFDNFKKRQAKEQERLSSFIMANFFRAALPIIEGFDRAFDGVDEETEHLKGFRMLYKSFSELFEKFGLKKQKVLGEMFDPLKFEAAGQVESNEPEGTVTAVVRDGFTLNDGIIRPAQVMISGGRRKDDATDDGKAEEEKGQNGNS